MNCNRCGAWVNPQQQICHNCGNNLMYNAQPNMNQQYYGNGQHYGNAQAYGNPYGGANPYGAANPYGGVQPQKHTAWSAYVLMLKRYSDFSGRSRRSEYWMAAVMSYLISFLFSMIISCFADDMMYDIVNGTGDVSGFVIFLYVVYMIYALILLIPELALCVRRLHDTGKSGWYMLIAFIPIIGAILLLVAMCTDSTPGHNKYGPNPKGVNPYGGNPYGGNPYGGNPYGGNPYGGNPYNR